MNWEEAKPRIDKWLQEMKDEQIEKYGHMLSLENPEDYKIMCAEYTKLVSKNLREVDELRAHSKAQAHLHVYMKT